MKFIKRIFLIFCCFFLFGCGAFADVKINNVNFDSSGGFMFLSTSNSSNTETHEISSTSLKKPNRVFYDINNAVLTRPNETWYFRNGEIRQIRVSQFTTNPNVVRVVFYHTDNFSPKNISVINIKGNFLFKYGDIKLTQKDFFTAYRSSHSESTDYLENVVYIPNSEVEKNTVQPSSAQTGLQSVQKAFSATSQLAGSPIIQPQVKNKVYVNFDWSKVFRLRTNYFLSRVDIKRGNILLLGSGRAAIEKPIYLTNPTRVVFDLPNTMVAKRFKNVEIQLSDNETLKVGQFEPNKVRLVITTPEPKAYVPIFSNDAQGILIGHSSRMSGIKLYEGGAQTQKTSTSQISSLSDEFKLEYAMPVVYSAREVDSKFELVVHNATGFNEELLNTAIANTKFSSVKGSKLDSGGVKYEFNLQQNTDVDILSREDGRALKVLFETKKQSKPLFDNKSDTNKGSSLIVIDPGHGGVDCGAIKAGVNEKDINLEVSKMIAQLLAKKGYRVDLTRWDDTTVSLQERVDFSDNNNAIIFVSVHVNSSISSEPNGIETHWWTDEGHELAEVVHASFAKKVKSVDRGLVKSKFFVINHTKAKSILVEIGFLSNDNERSELVTKERKQKTAEGIAEGIIKFMKKEGIR